ncbi:hypothetical protein GJ744_002907 [Endocarpon pusillum]|uniref:Uncharacterized protein n=1 Tax=Endocarpon pusillum TaxID=364733 RepID=A0A8H7E0X9_9EURO|nr:hypothetical protein GJ744_002907 [Endocarpon pusillum]
MFVLTDLHPHVEAWQGASKKSENVRFVAEGVDAADAPRDLVERATTTTTTTTTTGEAGRRRRGDEGSSGDEKKEKKKVMRLFSLAFHHFDDELAEGILRNTLETSDGFGIFELQSRTISSFITIFLFGPLLGIISLYYFWNRPLHLFFTYVVPLIPFCVVFDGYISSLRTRTPEEVEALLRKANGGRRLEGWRFMSGQEVHTWPTGWMSWVICVRE